MNQVIRRHKGYTHIKYEPNPLNRLGGVHEHTHTQTDTHRGVMGINNIDNCLLPIVL